MIRVFQQFLAFGALAFATQLACGQSAIEKYGHPAKPLPAAITFDCTFETHNEPLSFDALGSRLKMPNGFELDSENEGAVWLSWTILVKGEDDQFVEVPYAKIHIAKQARGIPDAFLNEFQLVAGPETNNLTASVYLRPPQAEDMSRTYWALLLRGDDFLKVIAYDPIDWLSLLPCFTS